MERFIATMMLSILMTVSSIAASAASVATVREGRVWEYVYEEYGRPSSQDFDGDLNYVMFRMRFDGTEERNGKVYHRLVYDDSITVWSYDNADDSGFEFKSIRTIPNKITSVYLMREEDSKVYLLYDGSYEAEEGIEPGDELLIYDFNCMEGDSYLTDFCMHYWEYSPLWCHGFAAGAGMNIKSSQTVEVEGENALMQTGRITVDSNKYPDFEKDIDYVMVEGIGSVTHGCLPFITFDLRTATRYFDYNLNRVYNDKGEIIYRGEDIDTTTLSIGRIAADVGSLSFANGTVKAVGAAEVNLTLYDINGSRVATGNATESAEIDTEGLPHGVYIAICKSQSGMKTLRIIL